MYSSRQSRACPGLERICFHKLPQSSSWVSMPSLVHGWASESQLSEFIARCDVDVLGGASSSRGARRSTYALQGTKHFKSSMKVTCPCGRSALLSPPHSWQTTSPFLATCPKKQKVCNSIHYQTRHSNQCTKWYARYTYIWSYWRWD